MRQQVSKSKGFTLIELLVVIAIIGLLSTLAVVALNSARQKSRDSKRVADVKQVQTALELYYADKNGYPVQTVTLGTTGALKLCDTGFQDAACTTSTYMGLVPKAPSPTDGAGCSDTTNVYAYSASASSTYNLNFCLGAKVGDLGSGVRTASPAGIQ